MSDRFRKYTGFFTRLWGVLGRKKIPTRKDWMQLKSGDLANCRFPEIPLLVHYTYHRYFWKATSGKNVKHVDTFISLN